MVYTSYGIWCCLIWYTRPVTSAHAVPVFVLRASAFARAYTSALRCVAPCGREIGAKGGGGGGGGGKFRRKEEEGGGKI
jgi:hypothetical protein